MKTFFKGIGADIKKIWNEGDKRAFAGMLYVTVILLLYCYFGTYSFFEKTFVNVDNLTYWSVIYHNFMPLFFFFALGLIFVKFVLKGNLKDFGLCIGDRKSGLKLLAILIPIFILSGLSAVVDKDMIATYPLTKYVLDAPAEYVVLYFVSYFCYYIGWEFLFRGILFFSTEKKSGVLVAIAVTTLISTLIHTSIAGFGKPFTETLSAVIAGLVFGYTAFKTRSIWYSLLMHMTVGFSMDIFIMIFKNAGLI